VQRPQKSREQVDWDRARRAAFVEDVLATLGQRPASLLSFDQIRNKLDLGQAEYQHLHEVPIDRISGSVDRYADFTREFLPRSDHLQHRWQAIAHLAHSGKALPPVELYKVGDVYFVRDGHHRVSVARQRGATKIEALIWECETEVPLEPDSDVDALLCQVAHKAFVERIDVGRLCPGVQIKLTHPDGYQEILFDIAEFQQIVAIVDEEPPSLDETVTLWCRLRYGPVVDVVRRQGVLEAFPGRTEADLYLWLCQNHEALQASNAAQVSLGAAATDLELTHGKRPSAISRFGRSLRRFAHRLGSKAERRQR
jgi:hypothetical protein